MKPREILMSKTLPISVPASFAAVTETLIAKSLALESDVQAPSSEAVMERTAAMLAYPRLDPGKATVGFEVCVKHVAGAPKGTHCTARARLDEIADGRKLRFAVDVTGDDGRTIGVGTHERRIVDVGSGGA